MGKVELTKENIESTGFVFSGKAVGIWYTMEGHFDMGTWTSYEIKLLHLPNDLFNVSIIAMDCGDEERLFRGKLNDTEELLDQLERCNIIIR